MAAEDDQRLPPEPYYHEPYAIKLGAGRWAVFDPRPRRLHAYTKRIERGSQEGGARKPPGERRQ